LIVVHRSASPERDAVGGFPECAPREDLGLLGPEPNVGGPRRNSEIGGDGAGEDSRWFGLTEPGKCCGGALERDAEPQPVPTCC